MSKSEEHAWHKLSTCDRAFCHIGLGGTGKADTVPRSIEFSLLDWMFTERWGTAVRH